VLAGLLALAVAAWVRRAPPGARGAAVAWLVLALVASVVLVAPFLLGFRSATHGLGVVGDRRGLLLWLRDTALMYGPALVLAAVPFLGVRRLPRRVVLGGAAAVVVLGAGLAPFDLAGVVVLLALLGVALWLLLGDRATDPADQVVWLLLAGGLACLLLPEVVYLRDEFDGGPFARMNTAFKFGYHAWVLLGLGGVAALARRRVSLPARGPRIAWAVVAAVVGLGALVYPVAGTWARKDGFAGSPTLDGLGWLRAKAPGDVGAIAWLNDHAPAGSVLLEAVGDDYSADGAARVSTFTGLPTVLGWAGHELQWDHDAGDRRTEVAALYRAASPAAAEPLLRRYRVRYVVAGPLELQTYGTSGVGIWNRLGRVVFSRAGTTVWDLGAR
jgi:uncharacterized membrane protein